MTGAINTENSAESLVINISLCSNSETHVNFACIDRMWFVDVRRSIVSVPSENCHSMSRPSSFYA